MHFFKNYKMKNFKILKISVYLSLLFLAAASCKDDDCEMFETQPANPECLLKSTINISSGVDEMGQVIAPGLGVADPYWKLLNNPPLQDCTNPQTASINGSAYVVNYLNFGNTSWVNQPNSSTLCPINLGTTYGFGCNNALNGDGARVPYVFERPFCVLQKTKVDINYTFKGDDQLHLELINNNTNTVISTSSTYTYPAAASTWNATGINLSAGSYSIRAYLVNINSTVLGFSAVGNITTTDGDLAISNNSKGCCDNNTISVLNIEEVEGCNNTFDAGDVLGSNWVFQLKNASGTIISTRNSDINGNVFFTGLPTGTYTVEIATKAGFTTATTTATVTVSGNGVTNVNFYNCKK